MEYISPFNPCLDSTMIGEERQSCTDRYIPSRKLLKKDSLYQNQSDDEHDEN